jgi:hypothetical protein
LLLLSPAGFFLFSLFYFAFSVTISVSNVEITMDFELAKKDAAQTEILTEFEKTVGELKLKNQVIIVIARD